MVEPNKTKCKVKVLGMETSKAFSDKILLQVEVLPFEEQKDTRFIKPGKIMEAFTFDTIPLSMEKVVKADAEYIGGPGGGKIFLTNLQNE